MKHKKRPNRRVSVKQLMGLLHNSPEKKTELSTTGRVEESSVLL